MQGTHGARMPTGVGLALAGLVTLAIAPAALGAQVVGHFKYVKEKGSVPVAPGATETSGDSLAKCGKQHKWHIGSGGALISGEPPDSFLATDGFGGNRSWYAQAWHTAEPKAKVTTYLVCVRQTSTVEDIKVTSIGAAPGDGSDMSSCPQGAILGGGTRPIGLPTDWFLNSLDPFDNMSDVDSIPDDGFEIYLRHRAGSTTSLLTDIVCVVTDIPDYKDHDVGLGTGSFNKAKVMCDSGHVVGGGALISGTVAQAHVTGTYPVDGGDADKAPDDGWEARAFNAAGGAKTLTVDAICL